MERVKEEKYLSLHQSITRQHKEAETARFTEVGNIATGVSFGMGRAKLALGDYLWVSTKDEVVDSELYRPVVDIEDDEIPHSTVLRYAIERKVLSDLSSRKHKDDHLKQLRRLACSSIVTDTFILIEGFLEMSGSHDTYQGAPLSIQPEDIECIAVDCALNIGECATNKCLFTAGDVDTASTLTSMSRIIRDQFQEERISLEEAAAHKKNTKDDTQFSNFTKQCNKEAKEMAKKTLQRTMSININEIRHVRDACLAIKIKKVNAMNICNFLAPVLSMGGISFKNSFNNSSSNQLLCPACNIFFCTGDSLSIDIIHCFGSDLIDYVVVNFFKDAIDVQKPSNVLKRIKQLAHQCNVAWSSGVGINGMLEKRMLLVVEKLNGQYGALRSVLKKIRSSNEFMFNNIDMILRDFINCLIIRHGWHYKETSDHKQTCRFLSVMAIRGRNSSSGSLSSSSTGLSYTTCTGSDVVVGGESKTNDDTTPCIDLVNSSDESEEEDDGDEMSVIDLCSQ